MSVESAAETAANPTAALEAPAARPGLGFKALGRRSVTIPGVILGWLFVLGSAPFWIPLALLADVFRGRFVTLRFGVFLGWVLSCEVFGITVSGALWLTALLLRVSRERYLDWHRRLQVVWARLHLHGAARIFNFRVEVEGDEAVAEPMLLFIRHASVGDTVLPSVLIEAAHDISLRYVLKGELLYGPCLDIVGNRLPSAFVDRYSNGSAAQIEQVAALLDGLGPRDGVLIYPEGTRPTTPEKRARALERLREKNPALAPRAEAFETLLPPRPGGPLALLERNPGLDVVFCAHEGFDDVTTLGALANGALIDRVIRVRFWRVPFGEIPKTREERLEWLFEHWGVLDRWVTPLRRRSAEAG